MSKKTRRIATGLISQLAEQGHSYATISEILYSAYTTASWKKATHKYRVGQEAAPLPEGEYTGNIREEEGTYVMTIKKKFDAKKPVQTVSGVSARIICTDRKGSHPIGALIANDTQVIWYTEDGYRFSSVYKSTDDLVNIPTKVTKYGLHKKDTKQVLPYLYDTQGEAVAASKMSVHEYDIVTVTWEES